MSIVVAVARFAVVAPSPQTDVIYPRLVLAVQSNLVVAVLAQVSVSNP